jgi:hypothetical protein
MQRTAASRPGGSVVVTVACRRVQKSPDSTPQMPAGRQKQVTHVPTPRPSLSPKSETGSATVPTSSPGRCACRANPVSSRAAAELRGDTDALSSSAW